MEPTNLNKNSQPLNLNPVPASPPQQTPSDQTPQPQPLPTQPTTPTSPPLTNGLKNNQDEHKLRSNKKLFIIIIIFLVISLLGALFVVDYFSSLGLSKAKDCFTEEAMWQEEIGEKMKATNSQEERSRILCQGNDVSINRLISCLEKVKVENSLSMDILEAYSKHQIILQEIITSHNLACPNSPISAP
jgi:hypothetical protein